MKNILIAHQSTIPHYRIAFYNALERLRPTTWCFDVVFDPSEASIKRFFKEPLDPQVFEFSILSTKTFTVRLGSKMFSYQTFWAKAARYDLVVVENAVNNLTYPLCHFHQLWGKRIAYWGHGKDRSIEDLSWFKAISERLKLILTRRADGFFAYTQGVKNYLEQNGVPAQKIFVLNNTIDIAEQRDIFVRFNLRRTELKEELGVQGKKVLLFVGRFTSNKRIDFLLQAFATLCDMRSDVHLFLVGSGGESYLHQKLNQAVLDKITYFGTVIDPEKLAPIYIASDIFAFPGSVGLGPLQALCYDLPVMTVDSPTHMPEIEYLSPQNSIILSSSTTPEEFACMLQEFFSDTARLTSLRATTWPSIQHLTIEGMAQNFIEGVNTMLDL